MFRTIRGWFRHSPRQLTTGSFDKEVMPLLYEYGVDPNGLKSIEDLTASLQEVIDRAYRERTARGTDVAAQLSYSLGVLLFASGNPGQAATAFRRAVEIGKRSASSLTLEKAAICALGMGDHGMATGEEEEGLLYDAMILGEGSNTASGLFAAARGAQALGLLYAQHDKEGARLVWRKATELGRKSGTQDGLEIGAIASWNIGADLEREWNRTRSARTKLQAEQAFRDAVELGISSTTQRGRGYANLASDAIGKMEEREP